MLTIMRTPAEVRFDRLHGIPSERQATLLLRAGSTLTVETREGCEYFEINLDRVLLVDRKTGIKSLIRDALVLRVLAISTLAEDGETYTASTNPEIPPERDRVVLNEISQRHLNRVLLARTRLLSETQ